MRWILLFTLAVLAGVLTVHAQSAAGRRFAPPPPDCAVQKIGGKTFATGEVYLSAHADTALLKDYGFRRFEFLGWSLGRAHYAAVWPVGVDLEALPAALDEIAYKTVDPDEVGQTEPIEEVIESLDLTRDDDSWTKTKRKSKVPQSSLQDFFTAEDPGPVPPASRSHLGTYEEYERNTAWRWPGPGTVARRKFEVNRDPNLTGSFRTQPVWQVPYTPPDEVEYGDYPGHRGTFFTRATSEGPFERTSDVVTRDPGRTGTFFSTSESHTTLRATPIQMMYRGQGATSGFQFGTPDGAARDYWRGVNSTPAPNTMSVSEYQRLYGRQKP